MRKLHLFALLFGCLIGGSARAGFNGSATVGAALNNQGVTWACVGVKRSNRSKPHCRRTVTLGWASYRARAGANVFAFSGIVAGHALKPGGYRLSVVATDAAGNSSAPAKLSFSIAP